jgi:heptose-I-phosphate ethanolaminephosphotransferase
LCEIFSLLFYSSLFTVRLVKLIMETDTRETSEFLSGLWAMPALWITVGCGAAAVLLAKGATMVWPHLHKMVRKVLIALFCVCTIWSALRGEQSYIKLIRCFTLDSVSQLNDERFLPSLRTPTIRFTYGVAFSVLTVREYKSLVPSVERTQVDACSFRSPCIVLVIGESFNKYHTPLYNPSSLPTTPNLCRLRDEGALYVFSDVVTQSNLTAQVMQSMLSTWSDDGTDSWTNHTLFPAVFRKAGYDVYYWSNQFVADGNGGLFSNLGGALVNHPDLARLQFTARNTSTFAYDSGLNSDLRTFIADSLDGTFTRPSLFIVHYIGQHVSYADRFPPDYDCFKADSLPTTYGGAHGRTIRAQYANATLFHDRCLNELWQLFADRDAVLVYLSDHGEECYDYRNFYERSDQNNLTPQVAHYQFEIPFFMMVSDSFQTAHPELVEQIQAAQDRPFVNSDICHVLFSLAGIATPDYRADRDLLSPDYNAARPRFIGDHVDYNTLIRQLK